MTKLVDDYIRQAIWKTYKKKCFYCDESLYLKNMQLDHVIPRNVFERKEEFVIAKYGLKDNFRFNSIENLVPACFSCNTSRKREKELKQAVHIWLAQVAEKVDKVLTDANKLKSQLSLDLPDQYKEFFVSSPDFMHSRLAVDTIRKKDISLYRELTFNSENYLLHLTSPNEDEVVSIYNLTDFEKYTEREYYPRTSADISFASLYSACLQLFEMLETAQVPKKRINFRDYVLKLPAAIILDAGINPDPAEILPEIKTVQDVITNTENIKVDWSISKLHIEITHKFLELQEEYETFIIEEIMQADFSGDGDIEILLFVYYRSPGTFRYSSPCLVGYIDNVWVIKNIVAKNEA